MMAISQSQGSDALKPSLLHCQFYSKRDNDLQNEHHAVLTQTRN